MVVLKGKGRKKNSEHRNMTREVSGNYLRAHRRRCRLSQRQLGILVGYTQRHAVGKHERSSAVPPLLVALAYEIVLEIPVSKLFTGFHAVVAESVARNKEELKADIERRPPSKSNTQTMQWLEKNAG